MANITGSEDAMHAHDDVTVDATMTPLPMEQAPAVHNYESAALEEEVLTANEDTIGDEGPATKNHEESVLLGNRAVHPLGGEELAIGPHHRGDPANSIDVDLVAADREPIDSEANTSPATGELDNACTAALSLEVPVEEDARITTVSSAGTLTVEGSDVSALPLPVIGSTEPEQFPFFRAPYDVRRAFYGVFFPIDSVVQLTYGPQKWKQLNPRGDVYGMAPEALALLCTCREVNEEMVNVLYGSNTFLLAPGEVNFHTRLSFPHANSSLFLLNLRPSTSQSIKKIHIHLGPALHNRFNDMLAWGLVDLPQVVVSLDPLYSLPPASLTQKRAWFREACQKIEVARAGVGRITFWDDMGNAASKHILEDAMPGGYQSVD